MRQLEDLQKLLGVRFCNVALLEQAIVHHSFSHENPELSPTSNERLEFLGDAVLDLIVTERLYQVFPKTPEGSLTKLRSALVCQETLSKLAANMDLGGYLRLGRGENKSRGSTKPSNLAGALESVIGAIYLDQGIRTTRRFILGLLDHEIQTQSLRLPVDYKSQLQELLDARKRPIPVYRVVETSGPAHDRMFTVEVLDEDRVLAKGSARSKKGAEMEAARVALEDFQKEL